MNLASPTSLLRSLALLVGALVATLLASAPAHAVEITNVRSGLKADVMWASHAHYQGVFLWPNNTSLSQEFTLDPSDYPYFRIRAAHSQQCLMIDFRHGNHNGTRIIQYPHCQAGYAPGEWYRSYVRDKPRCAGTHGCWTNSTKSLVIKNRATGRCLDAHSLGGATPAAQAPLQQWDCIGYSDDWNAGNQLWSIG